MKRNALVPYFLIMVLGICLVIALPLFDNGSGNEAEAGEENGGETVAQAPEDIYNSTCYTCHGSNYEGGAGPSLKGVGERLSADEIKDVLVNGRTGDMGTMPPGLIPDQANVDAMVEWLTTLE
ncbi:cytochrome c [Caldibacillus lycopersici]|uniref:Cytochrome c n=1 Tax=Perspicuibacillus lycopersici TaxID=1325689 RepID=A0AAE3LTF0_9BACI|nr:cytochrome c [Perspicuibacillus lycopersici]MCU9613903.1 cytochrome c [Perspicuibacillus lycopersici]